MGPLASSCSSRECRKGVLRDDFEKAGIRLHLKWMPDAIQRRDRPAEGGHRRGSAASSRSVAIEIRFRPAEIIPQSNVQKRAPTALQSAAANGILHPATQVCFAAEKGNGCDS